MKKFLSIWALTLLLVASVFMLTKTTTNAATTIKWSVSLFVNTGVSTCYYGTAWNAGSITASFTQKALTWTFAGWFGCTDMEWLATWSMTIQTSWTNMSGANNAIIPNVNNVYLIANTHVVTGWTCTLWTNTTALTEITTTARAIIAKGSSVGQICTVATSWVRLQVLIPANAAIWTYTWNLDLVMPF